MCADSGVHRLRHLQSVIAVCLKPWAAAVFVNHSSLLCLAIIMQDAFLYGRWHCSDFIVEFVLYTFFQDGHGVRR